MRSEPSWRNAEFSEMQAFDHSSLTALASRQAVPPSGQRLRRCLPRAFQGAWFYLKAFSLQPIDLKETGG
jgi:hypothetical protein